MVIKKWFVHLLGLTLGASVVGGLALGGTFMEKKIKVHGHRGSRGTRPENTMPAFQEGAASGADYLELDLHLSADNQLIISHDPVISGGKCRDASGKPVKTPLPIRKLLASEISKFDCGSIAQKDFPQQVLMPHTPHPTLEELLLWANKSAPHIGLNIEIKMDGPTADLIPSPKDFVTRVIKVEEKYGRLSKDILQSFDLRVVTEAHVLAPILKTSCLFENTESNKHFWELTVKAGCHIASPHFSLVTQEAVRQCHERGIQVVPWTVNEPHDWKRLVALGVDGIITDYPKRLLDSLKSVGR